MRSSLLSAMRKRTSLVVASAGLATACAASIVAVLPEDHASAHAVAAAPAAAVVPVASATAKPAQQPAPQPAVQPAQQPAPQQQPAKPQQAPAPAAPQAASRSEVRPVLQVTDTSPSGLQALARSIVPADQFASFSNIVSHESSWNIYATNPSSGSYGLGQALPASKMASAGSDWRTNPVTQIKWALSYMDGRYGSPNAAWAFWQTHHWY